MEFNFPHKKGTGIERLIPHVSPDAIDLIYKLLIYDPEDRISAEEALRHPYFREYWEMENMSIKELHSTLSTMKLSLHNNKYNRTMPENVENLTLNNMNGNNSNVQYAANSTK